MIDTTDEKILHELRRNAKQTTGQIAKRTSIPTTTVHNRIKRLERDGVIKSYAPILDHRKLGKDLLALVFVAAEHTADQQELARRLRTVAGVESAKIITGDFDILLELRAQNVEELNTIITEKLRKTQGILRTQTTIVLKEM
jgi:DNA-binding Lrp family transcriptional regulator